MAITYRDLLKRLLTASEEQLAQDVTVYSQVLKESSPVDAVHRAGSAVTLADGILDDGHLYLEYDG